MIHRIGNCFSGPNVQCGLPDGRWVAAVPEPFYDGLLARIGNAWAVLTGRAYAFHWPEPGELEAALSKAEGGEGQG